MKTDVLELFPDQSPNLPIFPGQIGFSAVWQTAEWGRFLLRSGWAKRGFFIGIPAESPKIWAFFELRSVGLGQFGLFCVGGPTVFPGADLESFAQKTIALA